MLGFARCCGCALEWRSGDWRGKGPPLAASSVRLRLGGFEMGSAAADARFEIVLGVPVPPFASVLRSGRPKWQLFETGTVRFVPVVTRGGEVRIANNKLVELSFLKKFESFKMMERWSSRPSERFRLNHFNQMK